MRKTLALLALALALFLAPLPASADDGSGCARPDGQRDDWAQVR